MMTVRQSMKNSSKALIIAETDSNNQVCGLWLSDFNGRVRATTAADLLKFSLDDAEFSGAPKGRIKRYIKSSINK